MFMVYCYLDKSMVRAALQPMADPQQFCSEWIERYVDTYGDKAPDKDEWKLQIIQRRDLYKQYKKDMESSSPPQKIVSEARFNTIWQVLFPTCTNRPWCDIPGKCDTCYNIDKMRRESEDKVVQNALKEAHHLHRGGLFMLERRA